MNLSLTQSSIWCVILYETLCLRAHSQPHWRKNPGVKPKERRSNPDVLMLVLSLMAAWVTNSMMELGRLYLFTMRMSWELSTFIPLTYEKRSLLELAFLYHVFILNFRLGKAKLFLKECIIFLNLKFEIDGNNDLESVIWEDSFKQKAEISNVSLHPADKKPFLAINNQEITSYRNAINWFWHYSRTNF